MRILIAEDEALIAMDMEDILSRAGHDVVGLATNRTQALRMAEHAAPQLALIDIALDDGETGLQLARELHGRWGTKSIVVSGLPANAESSGLTFLPKPCTADMILAAVGYMVVSKRRRSRRSKAAA